MDFDDDKNEDISDSVIESMEENSLATNGNTNRTDLLRTVFIDGKNLKKYFTYFEKLHVDTVFQFYKNGIWGKIIGLDEDGKYYENVSSTKFPAGKLLTYVCNLELLPDYNEESPENNFFTLTFKTLDLVEFMKTTGANSYVNMNYDLGSKKVILSTDGDSSYDLNVKFSTDDVIMPIEGDICDENLLPIINIISSGFTEITHNLTRFKKHGYYENYIDFQIDDETFEGSCMIHSSSNKFNKVFGNYNKDKPHDVRFIIGRKMMTALSCLSKVNDKGFVSLFFVDDTTLRISIQIGNFAQYDNYILPVSGKRILAAI